MSVRIVDIQEVTKPIASAIRNAYRSRECAPDDKLRTKTRKLAISRSRFQAPRSDRIAVIPAACPRAAGSRS